MSDHADTQDQGFEPGHEDPTAGASEPMIPKHRLDETLGKLRERDEQLTLMRELLNQQAQARQPQAQQQAPAINFEQFGVDQQTGQAFMEIAKQVARQELSQESQMLKRQLGMQQNSIEEMGFLHKYGADKEQFLPLIRQKKQEYAQKYGSYLPAEDAYRLVVAQNPRPARRPGPHPGQQAPAQQAGHTTPNAAQQTGFPALPQDGGYPDPNLTRTQAVPSGGIPQGQVPGFEERVFDDEQSLAELEAQIDEQVRSGHLRF